VSLGGPFGIEPTVKAAGNLYAIIGVALFPFLWAIPEIYMTFRLSTLYPCASGVSYYVSSHVLCGITNCNISDANC
jgi:hypothetical protein